jgi:hypothetical protein
LRGRSVSKSWGSKLSVGREYQPVVCDRDIEKAKGQLVEKSQQPFCVFGLAKITISEIGSGKVKETHVCATREELFDGV